jgi:hypothetical protein
MISFHIPKDDLIRGIEYHRQIVKVNDLRRSDRRGPGGSEALPVRMHDACISLAK